MSFEEQIMSKDKYPCIFLKPNGGFTQGRILGDLFSKPFKRQSYFTSAQNIASLLQNV